MCGKVNILPSQSWDNMNWWDEYLYYNDYHPDTPVSESWKRKQMTNDYSNNYYQKQLAQHRQDLLAQIAKHQSGYYTLLADKKNLGKVPKDCTIPIPFCPTVDTTPVFTDKERLQRLFETKQFDDKVPEHHQLLRKVVRQEAQTRGIIG